MHTSQEVSQLLADECFLRLLSLLSRKQEDWKRGLGSWKKSESQLTLIYGPSSLVVSSPD